MNKPNNKRSRSTDEAIIRAAFECMVLGGKPVSRVTVREICERAGINRSTFYAHYLDVYDLFEKVELQMAGLCYERMHHSFLQGQGFSGMLEGVFQFVEEYREFYQLYFIETNRATHLIEVMNSPFQERLQKIQEEDMGGGIPGERAYHLQFFTAGMTAVLVSWIMGNCKESPQEMVGVLERVYGPNSLMKVWLGASSPGQEAGEPR